MRLTRLTDVKAILEMNEDSVKYDDFLNFQINTVSGEFEEEMNRFVLSGSKTEVYDIVSEYQVTCLRSYPVTSITTIWNSWDRTYPTSSIVASTSYYVDLAKGLLSFPSYQLTCGAGVLKITYTGGMAANPEAFIAAYPSIAGACAMEVAARFQNRATLGKIAVTLQGGSVTVAQRHQFLTPVMEVLERYTRIG